MNDVLFRRASWSAGLGLFFMAVIAAWSNFAVLEALIIPNNAAKTSSNILESLGLFRLGVLGFLGVVLLDVLVSWGLFVVFARVDESLSRLAAWFRLVYTAIFAVAIAQLFGIPQLLENPLLPLEQNQALVLLSTQHFKHVWDAGLLLFGVHLLLLGVLAWRSGYVPRWLGFLLLVAGIGYVFDSVAAILGNALRISSFTFLGEFLLTFCLFWVASRKQMVTA
jgi:Domain of unknown function (DUF4386)